ncbi:MAG: YneF family protein [Defluviitaleaceae bacterium]|nr:YneF family protein [Defluviitaleaceae bacterium]
MNIILAIVLIILGILAGAVGGFFIAQRLMKKHLQENPPITEEVIVAMMSQMGRKPSQKQVNQVMKQINENMK